MTREEEAVLAPLAAAGDIDAANTLAMHTMGLAIMWATSYTGRGVMFEDLAGAAMLACVEASRSYRPIGYRFMSYAAYCIAGAVRKELSEVQGVMSLKSSGGKINKPAISIDEEVRPGLTIGESVVDDCLTIDEKLDAANLEEAVISAIRGLKEPYQTIIARRWIDDEGDCRLRTLGKEMGVSYEKVRLDEKAALDLIVKRHGHELRNLLG